MITRLDADRFLIQSLDKTIDIEVAAKAMPEYLASIIHCGERLWSDALIAGVMALDVGDSTYPGFYKNFT